MATVHTLEQVEATLSRIQTHKGVQGTFLHYQPFQSRGLWKCKVGCTWYIYQEHSANNRYHVYSFSLLIISFWNGRIAGSRWLNSLWNEPGVLIATHEGVVVRSTLDNIQTQQLSTLIPQLAARTKSVVRDLDPEVSYHSSHQHDLQHAHCPFIARTSSISFA